jgi:hypothetical protein
VVQLFDEGTLIVVSRAYSLLDAVPAMKISERDILASTQRNARSGWIDQRRTKIHHAFMDADKALENLHNRLPSQTLGRRLKQGQALLGALFNAGRT